MRHLENLEHADRNARPNRRTRGRVVSMGLTCPLGRLDDLSAGGLRLITGKRALTQIGRVVDVPLRGDDLEGVVPARVVWARKHSLLKWIVGMEWECEGACRVELNALLVYVSRENATSWRPAA